MTTQRDRFGKVENHIDSNKRYSSNILDQRFRGHDFFIAKINKVSSHTDCGFNHSSAGSLTHYKLWLKVEEMAGLGKTWKT